ncbi:hypothetical protein STBA_05400 [Streptomyces sp. MP131-18]|nr:hypothetical protein STBA_05400 [Streptomyces sp. MP131-18]
MNRPPGGMGLHPPLHHQDRTNRRPGRLPPHLQPPSLPHRTRRQATHQPRQQPAGNTPRLGGGRPQDEEDGAGRGRPIRKPAQKAAVGLAGPEPAAARRHDRLGRGALSGPARPAAPAHRPGRRRRLDGQDRPECLRPRLPVRRGHLAPGRLRRVGRPQHPAGRDARARRPLGQGRRGLPQPPRHRGLRPPHRQEACCCSTPASGPRCCRCADSSGARTRRPTCPPGRCPSRYCSCCCPRHRSEWPGGGTPPRKRRSETRYPGRHCRCRFNGTSKRRIRGRARWPPRSIGPVRRSARIRRPGS